MEWGIFIPGILGIVIAGIFYAAMWKVYFHYNQSIFRYFKNQQFFNPELSWKNKWKTVNGKMVERFPGSSTIFVFVTDFFHLAQAIFLTAVFFVITLAYIKEVNLNMLLIFIGSRIIFGLVFEFCLKNIFVKK